MQNNPQKERLLREVLELEEVRHHLQEDGLALPSSPDSGRIGTMDSELIDAKVAASEARTDTKFAELIGKTDTKFAEMMGELRRINTRLDHMPTLWTLIGTVGAGVVAAIGIVLAVLSYTGDRMEAASSQGATLARIEARLDRIDQPRVVEQAPATKR